MNLQLTGTMSGLRPTAPLKVSAKPAVSQPHRVALALAGAHRLQWRIDSGEFAGRAEAARALGLLPPRVSQILDLTLLAPDIQEEVLSLKQGDLPITEWDLRWVLGASLWAEQRTRWAEVKQPQAVSAVAMAAVVVSSRRRPSV
jgi:hypothetical protein